MIGNVWVWTCDCKTNAETSHACCTIESYDPQLPDIRSPPKVMTGGSHLCAPNYHRRYRPAARMPQPIDTATSHLGIRCIIRA
jgi:sulfatase modifying factor 1